MKKIFKMNVVAILIISMFLLNGCSLFDKVYTYKNENITFQYDGDYLKTTQIENMDDIIIRPLSGGYSSFVDVSIVSTIDGNDYDDILSYMKSVYTYNLDTEIEITKEEKSTIKTEFGENEQSELNYNYIQDEKFIMVESKAINIEANKVFVIIKKITKDTLEDETLNALNTTFDSVLPYK